MKKAFIIVIIIVIIFLALSWLGRPLSVSEKPTWGVSFSEDFSKKMGLDWQKVYLALLDDLKFRKIRLIAYWPEVEPQEGQYYFNDLDWQVQEAGKRGGEIIMAVGRKLPRWPECHEPDWTQNKITEVKNEKLLKYIEAVIKHYQDEPSIVAWQIENEPFLRFGECPGFSQKFLDQEVSLARSLDSRPIIVTDSGELSLWYQAAKRADIFGTTMYRIVWWKYFGRVKYPLPPAYFRAKQRIIRTLLPPKPMIVVELQAEPWLPKMPYETTPEQQFASFNVTEFENTINYAKETGFSEFYLWGGEWWYWLKTVHKNNDMWEAVRKVISQE